VLSREDAEKGYLSAFLHDNGILGMSPKDCGQLDSEMFTTYRVIFDQACKLATRGKVRKTDLLSLASAKISGLVAELDPYTSANWEFYHKVIFEAWAQELIERTCKEAAGETYPRSVDILDKGLTTLSMREGGTKTVTGGEILPAILARIEERIKSGGNIPGIKTGMQLVDQATLGLGKGQFIIIAGRPSSGKSALGWQLARFIARSMPIGFISLEDSKEDLTIRGLAAESQIDSRALITGQMDHEELVKYRDGIYSYDKIKDNLLIHEHPAMTLHQAEGEMRAMVRRGAQVLFYDYLQLTNIKGNMPKHEQVALTSNTFKAVARELNTPLISLAQLRKPEGYDKRPSSNSGDIQHSDQPGQDADQVWFRWDKRDKNGIIEDSLLIIDKARNGAPRDIKIEFNRPTLTIKEKFPQ